jgi:Zn-dependent protease
LHRNAFRSKAAQSIAAAAGPLTNAAFAAVTLGLVHANQHSTHGRFWLGIAFFGFLQVSAAVLNLLPVPGLDGWAIIEPYLDPATVRGAEPVKPWGMLGVIVLLQVNQLNTWFFNAVYRLFEISGIDRNAAAVGRELFRFWQKQPF